MDLADYAAQRPGGHKRRRCITCALPNDVLKQVNQAREADHRIPFPTISRWLWDEHQVNIQPATVRNHFVAGHQND